MNDLLTINSDEVAGYFATIKNMQEQICVVIENFRPLMNGEIYLSGADVCSLLHITKRTLQQYRDDGIIPYIQFPGKIIYKQSDILNVLDRNYIPPKE